VYAHPISSELSSQSCTWLHRYDFQMHWFDEPHLIFPPVQANCVVVVDVDVVHWYSSE